MNHFTYPQLNEQLYRQRLDNGLELMVLPRRGFSRKIAYFVTSYGAIHTAFSFEGKQHRVPDGIAHFLEHKLFDMPGGRDVSAEFAAWGANTNAFTSYDMTAYYFSCTENFSQCLRLLLEFVSTPYFTAESVEKELGIIDQEIGMNEDAPDNRVYENLLQSAYAQHPIRVPILGTRESIREITPQMLHLVHRAFYNPGNMTLCVVGDVDAQEVQAIANEILGDQPREVGVKIANWDEPLTVSVPEIQGNMEVAMPMFSLVFKAAPVGTGEAGFCQELTADLACELLFGESSELYQRLYQEGTIDTAFGGGFEVVDGCAMLMISGDSEDPRRVREAILAQAEDMIREGIPEAEFRRLLRATLGSRIKALDNFDSTCFRLCAYHMTDYDYLRFPAAYEKVTAEDVRQFLARVIRRESCALSVIYPIHQEDDYES